MNIRFSELKDVSLIRQAICHPLVYPHVSDDGSPPANEYQPPTSLMYVGSWVDDAYAGVFILHAHNSVMAEVHTCLLPDVWGKSVKISRGLVEWVFSATQTQRLITSVPGYNRLALRLAKSAGMQQYGVNPASFMKSGKLHDLVMLGVSKER